MRRRHLVELHEQPWFPAAWRDLVTDFLSFFFRAFRPYRVIAPVLAEALERSRTENVIDLCSGAGAPVLSLLPALRGLGRCPRSVVLTDLYPNRDAFRIAAASDAGVAVVETPVDAADVPADLVGFRTLFTSFHHFSPPAARAILADARSKGEGIGVFEFTERNLLLWLIPVLAIPFFVAACTPFMRPFRWRRLLWTYLVPVVPLVAGWDGLVSNLRSYTRGELLELAGAQGRGGYVWRTGRVRSLGLSGVTYLVGWPASAELRSPR